jgi:hypothetical protein
VSLPIMCVMGWVWTCLMAVLVRVFYAACRDARSGPPYAREQAQGIAYLYGFLIVLLALMTWAAVLPPSHSSPPVCAGVYAAL